MGRADDEVAVGVDRRHRAVGQLGGVGRGRRSRRSLHRGSARRPAGVRRGWGLSLGGRLGRRRGLRRRAATPPGPRTLGATTSGTHLPQHHPARHLRVSFIIVSLSMSVLPTHGAGPRVRSLAAGHDHQTFVLSTARVSCADDALAGAVVVPRGHTSVVFDLKAASSGRRLSSLSPGRRPRYWALWLAGAIPAAATTCSFFLVFVIVDLRRVWPLVPVWAGLEAGRRHGRAAAPDRRRGLISCPATSRLPGHDVRRGEAGACRPASGSQPIGGLRPHVSRPGVLWRRLQHLVRLASRADCRWPGPAAGSFGTDRVLDRRATQRAAELAHLPDSAKASRDVHWTLAVTIPASPAGGLPIRGRDAVVSGTGDDARPDTTALPTDCRRHGRRGRGFVSTSIRRRARFTISRVRAASRTAWRGAADGAVVVFLLPWLSWGDEQDCPSSLVGMLLIAALVNGVPIISSLSRAAPAGRGRRDCARAARPAAPADARARRARGRQMRPIQGPIDRGRHLRVAIERMSVGSQHVCHLPVRGGGAVAGGGYHAHGIGRKGEAGCAG